jgi:hypothetical protein
VTKWVRGGERPKPFLGSIVDLRAFELHGTPYWAVLYRLDGDDDRAPEATREARLSADMVYDGPAAGDRVLITSVLGVVDRIDRAG